MSYDRQHLRAPYRSHVLFVDGDFVFKAKADNISEGGILLGEVPTLPASGSVDIMLMLPLYPRFKDYSLDRLQRAVFEEFEANVIRVRGNMVRRVRPTVDIDDVFNSKFGIQFTRIESPYKALISDYVESYIGNIVTLQRAIESVNARPEAKVKTRLLARLLGYGPIEKIADLRVMVEKDYRSLQWLD